MWNRALASSWRDLNQWARCRSFRASAAPGRYCDAAHRATGVEALLPASMSERILETGTASDRPPPSPPIPE
jgi:hypothetical protein